MSIDPSCKLLFRPVFSLRVLKYSFSSNFEFLKFQNEYKSKNRSSIRDKQEGKISQYYLSKKGRLSEVNLDDGGGK